MKLKFVLILLMVLGFTTGCSSTKGKNQIYVSSENEDKSKWITPSKETCMNYGGIIYKGVCRAEWSVANDICNNLNAKLPTKYELNEVFVDCGGIIKDAESNRANSSYQSCYKRRGFVPRRYWSSTPYANYMWSVHFGHGSQLKVNKSNRHSVRCVRTK